MHRGLLLLALLAGASGCASRRILTLENELLRAENARLLQRNHELEIAVPDERDYVRAPDLETVARWLTRGGIVHEWTSERRTLRFDFSGRNASFGVTIQHFEGRKVLFMATTSYLRLDDAPGPRGVVMLLVKLAALNYDLVVGKFQLNPETGDVLLSVELHVDDGLGYDTFVKALDTLTRLADEKYPELSRAAGGQAL